MSPHPPSWKSILILSSHLRLCFPSGPFPTGFPTSSVPYTRYMAHPLNSSRFDHTHFISWGIQIIKFLIILFCPLPFYIDTFGPKYSPQHPILKHPQSPFLPQCERPCFTPTQNNRQCMYISVFTFLDSKLDDKRFCTEWQQAFPAWIFSRIELIHYGCS